MPTITFATEKKEIQVPEGANLRKRHSLQESHLPGSSQSPQLPRHGILWKLRVLITKGMENTSPRGLLEKARMGVSMAYIGNEETMRLACQTRVNGDITVTTCPPTNLYGENFFS